MDVKTELSEFNKISSKIIQAFRIRLNCLKRRIQIMNEIENNFDKISNMPDFFHKLEHVLMYEKKILKILRMDDKQEETVILDVIKKIMSYKGKEWPSGKVLSEFARESNVTWGTEIETFYNILDQKQLKKFFEGIILFLEHINKDIKHIMHRIEKEELLLKYKSIEYFREFVNAWKEELKINKGLVKDYIKMVRADLGIIREVKDNCPNIGGAIDASLFEQGVPYLAGGSIGTLMMVGILGKEAFKGLNYFGTVATVSFLGIGAFMVLGGLVFVIAQELLGSFDKKGWERHLSSEYRRTERLINEMYKKKMVPSFYSS